MEIHQVSDFYLSFCPLNRSFALDCNQFVRPSKYRCRHLEIYLRNANTANTAAHPVPPRQHGNAHKCVQFPRRRATEWVKAITGFYLHMQHRGQHNTFGRSTVHHLHMRVRIDVHDWQALLHERNITPADSNSRSFHNSANALLFGNMFTHNFAGNVHT